MFRFVLAVTLAALAGASYVPSKIPTDEGIVGGVDTTIEEHPYQLVLILNNIYACGASLIKPNVALTAAHCTQRKGKWSVRAGSTYASSGGQLANVLRIFDHPKYNSDGVDYDVSVLLLDKSLPVSATIKPIDLQPVGVEVPEGTLATVTGWGSLTEGGSAPLVLQKVEVPKVSHRKCYPIYGITERMSCYGFDQGGKDSCVGDSGGPIVVNGKQTGIVSYGDGCARPGLPGVYAKISNKEISDHINNALQSF